MLSEEQKVLLLDRQKRTVVSSFNAALLPEQEFPEEAEWRTTHTQSHFRREVMVMLSGEHSVRFKEKTFAGFPGMMLILNSREKHDAAYFPGTGKSSHLWLIIRPDFINCQCDEMNDGKFTVNFRHFYRDRERIAELNRIWDAGVRGMIAPEIALMGIQALLDLVIFDILKEKTNLRIHYFDPAEEAVEKVKSYLDSTNGKNASITFLAGIAGFSPMHFQRLFKKSTGMTVGKYINMLRIKRCEELKNVCSTKEIAEELGFSSPSAFCNWKKKLQ